MNIRIWEMRRSVMIKIYFSCGCYQKRVSVNVMLRTSWCQWSAEEHNVMFDWMSSNSLKCLDGATCRATVCFSFVISVNNWCSVGKTITWKTCQGYVIFLNRLSRRERCLTCEMHLESVFLSVSSSPPHSSFTE